MNMDKSETATQGGQPATSNDPEEALLPDLGFSPTRALPVEIAAQQHHHGFDAAQTVLEQQQQQLHQPTTQNYAPSQPPQLEQSQQPMQPLAQMQHQDPLNALTTLAVAAAPPHQQQTYTLLDVMTGPHQHALQQQQPGGYSFAPDGSSQPSSNYSPFPMPPPAPQPPINMDDPAALAAALAAKDKEIKALRRALNKAQRKNPPPAARDSTASMIGEAVLSITNKNDPEENQMDPNKIKNLQERWKARFQQLVRFKLKHGHCNVPKSYHDPPLHAWVRKQRINKQIRDRTGGVKGLTQEQVASLDSIGFSWFIGHQPRDDLWQSNYERLVQLYSVHGYIPTHCNDKSLTKWMQNQRARRKLLDAQGEGKARGMTWERVQKLDAIGFTWDARK